MMKQLFLVLAATAVICSAPNARGENQPGQPHQPTPAPQPNKPVAEAPTERVFAKLHSTNQMEIQLAQLALQKAESQDVKDYAQMMINDHTLAEQQLAPLAQQIQTPVHDFTPQTQTEIKDHQMDQQVMDKLNQANGKDFDKLYLKSQVVMHRKVLNWLGSKRSFVDHDGAKDFVDLQRKTINRHLTMAKRIYSKI